MNVGDYVRTPKGIGKIESIEIDKQDTIIHLDCGITIDYITKDFTEEEINKMYPSSPQIIDLIEVEDYVNGFYVINKPFNNQIHTEFDDFLEEDIETVLTHEQMEAMQYRVEE